MRNLPGMALRVMQGAAYPLIGHIRAIDRFLKTAS
jgi:hypothetical protein